MAEAILTAQWIQTLESFACIYVGFSGGLDSTALLNGLAEIPTLSHKVVALHINHGLSPNAQHWQAHCLQVCQSLGITYQCIAVSIPQETNIEEAARTARYGAFAPCIGENACLLTAHHLDDQAETLLLHLFRGAGVNGLAGMRQTQKFSQGMLFRPLLTVSRQQLLQYASCRGLSWIDDESNTNEQFSRNFIRQQVIPLLQTKWPAVSQTVARTSQMCRQAQSNLEDLALLDCPTVKDTIGELHLPSLKSLSEERLPNVLRLWLQHHDVRMPNQATFTRLIRELIHADHDANPEVAWDKVVVQRFRNTLYLSSRRDEVASVTIKPQQPLSWPAFPEPLIMPDARVLLAFVASQGVIIRAGDCVEVRYRQGGENFFFRGQNKALKKLMQEWAIPPWLRARTPLLYINDELAVVVGYAISDRYFGENKSYCYDIVHKRY